MKEETSSKNNYYHGKKISGGNNNNNNGELIRKGPWKPEEDQVLIDHVAKYGPRDWSSIRSKGLLLRIGKSCRLRWVNKLRPDLKNGCKFTAEEERIVIELQSELGNKWAAIATHLPGRTDNDVKNFWSSRQKRLKRILQSDSNPLPLKRCKSSSTTSSIDATNCSFFDKVPKAQSSSSLSHVVTNTTTDTTQTTTTTTTFLNTAKAECPTSEPNINNSGAINLNPIPVAELQPYETVFPSIPPFQTFLPIPSQTEELVDRLDSGFLHAFGCTDDQPVFADDVLQLPSCFAGELSSQADIPVTPDSFFDDFPSDVFDQIEPLPSPSSW